METECFHIKDSLYFAFSQKFPAPQTRQYFKKIGFY